MLDDGASINYDKLALTTGARARKLALPGHDLPGVCYLRDMSDVEHLKVFASNASSVVICGGGYIGLEPASVLRQQGMKVTVLEMMPRVLQRVVTPELSGFYTRVHEEEGVTIVTNVEVASFEGNDTVNRVVCKDGRVFPADLVIIGVGVVPNVELAQTAGLTIDNGIVVDEFARTSDPNIVAAGDCTFHHNRIYNRHMRLECVQNAVAQANIAASTLCEKPEVYDSVPWFWSNQYDLELKIAGLSQGFDEVCVRGDMDTGRSFAVFYFRGQILISVEAVNRPQEFLVGKRLLRNGSFVNKAALADEALPIKTMLLGQL